MASSWSLTEEDPKEAEEDDEESSANRTMTRAARNRTAASGGGDTMNDATTGRNRRCLDDRQVIVGESMKKSWAGEEKILQKYSRNSYRNS